MKNSIELQTVDDHTILLLNNEILGKVSEVKFVNNNGNTELTLALTITGQVSILSAKVEPY